MDKETAWSKKETLVMNLKEFSSLLVAFSGGVDSAFLLALASQVLGENVSAVTAASIVHPARELEEAKRFTHERGIRHIIIKSNESSLPEFISNSPDRCYHCKKSLSKRLIAIAKERDIEYIAFATNQDDLGDYRPGTRAAEEMGIISPLLEVKLGKDEIRFLSKEMGLSTWDRPAMACLASRIPYGNPITPEKLKMVEDAEDFLSDKGFDQVRVRHYGSMARIEVNPSAISRIVEKGLRMEVVERFREIGFMHISVDLEGHVSGNMNRELAMENIHES